MPKQLADAIAKYSQKECPFASQSEATRQLLIYALREKGFFAK